MDKTLADCWDFVQKHQPSAWYFAGADLLITDGSDRYGWQSSINPAGKLTLEMTADALRDLARLVHNTS